MRVYLFVFFVSSFLFYLGSHYKSKWNPYSLLALFIPAYVAGARGVSVGTDTEMYVHIYESALNYHWSDIFYAAITVEPSYFVISKMAAALGGIFYLFFIYQLLTLVPIYLTVVKFKKYVNVGIVFFIYFCLLYSLSFNLVRQMAAVSFLFYGASFLLEQGGKSKYIKFLVCLIVGTLLHSSCLIGGIFIIVLYYFFYLKNSRIYIALYLIGLCLLVMMFLYIGPLLAALQFGKFESYGTAYAVQRSSYVSVTELLYRGAFAIILWSASYWKILNKKMTKIYAMILLSETIIMFLGLYNGFLVRIAIYFTVFHLIGLPLIIHSKRFTSKSRTAYSLVIALIFFIYWYWTIVHNGTNAVIPYKFA